MANNEAFGSGNIPKKGDTLRMLLVKDVKAVLAGGGGGGGGSNQIKPYGSGSDPNTDGILPDNVNAGAVSYSEDGTGPNYNWSIDGQVWI